MKWKPDETAPAPDSWQSALRRVARLRTEEHRRRTEGARKAYLLARARRRGDDG